MTRPRPSRKLVILLRPSPDRRRLGQVLSWVRALAPAAILLMVPARLPELPDAELLQLDCGDALDGPLSLADQLARQARR
jgi:hypothetical protein